MELRLLKRFLLSGATEMALSTLLCFTGQLQRGCSFGSIPTRDVQEEFGGEPRTGPVTINQRACEATCTQGVKDGGGGRGAGRVQSGGRHHGRQEWQVGSGGWEAAAGVPCAAGLVLLAESC